MGDHLIVLHSAVRACAGYNRHEAPSILMDGSSIARDTEHGRAVTAQLTRRQGTLEEAIEAGIWRVEMSYYMRGFIEESCEVIGTTLLLFAFVLFYRRTQLTGITTGIGDDSAQANADIPADSESSTSAHSEE